MARLSGMLLTSRLSIIVAAASIGAQQELITPEAKGAAIFPLVLLTCLLDPTVFKPTAKGEVKSA
jgi:hypothetical protein